MKTIWMHQKQSDYKPKKIGIVGSRSRDTNKDMQLIADAFFKIYRPGDIIVSGGCEKGGDRFAEIIAETRHIPKIIHYPDQKKLKELKAKGVDFKLAYTIVAYDRNTLIAEDIDELIACVAENRKGGTEDTIKKFEKLHPDKKAIIV